MANKRHIVLSTFIFILFLTPFIIGAVWIGTASLGKRHTVKRLQWIAEEYVKNAYGNHYSVSEVEVSSTASASFMEYIYGIDVTFRDNNKQEIPFQIYVSNYDESVNDTRYVSENRALYKEYVADYVKGYINAYGISEDEYEFTVFLETDNSNKHVLWQYQSYEEMVSDENEMNHLKVTFELKVPNTKPDFVKYRWAYDVYKNLNRTKYQQAKFELSFKDTQTYEYTGVYENGKCNLYAVPDYANIEYAFPQFPQNVH